MSEKLYEYQGCIGVLHAWRDSVKEQYQLWKEENVGLREWLKQKVISKDENKQDSDLCAEFAHHER